MQIRHKNDLEKITNIRFKLIKIINLLQHDDDECNRRDRIG